MKRKALLTLFSITISLFSINAFAESTIDTIGDIVYEIPDGYALIDEKDNDDMIIKTYQSTEDGIVFRFISSAFESDDSAIIDLMKQATLTGIKKDSNYKEISPTKTVNIDNLNTRGDYTVYTTDNYDTIQAYISFYTGENIVGVLGGFPMSTASDKVDAFGELIDSISRSGEEIEITETEASKTIGKYAKGKYKVGTDIPAGEYTLFADGGKGYFAVTSDSNGSDIIFNDNFVYNSIITINDGEYLELSRCYAVPYGEMEIDVENGDMFKVGKDIPSGEYKVDSGHDRGYYCIYPDSRQKKIIANDLFEGQNYFTVSDGQYLVLSGCTIITMPEVNSVSQKEVDPKLVQEKLNEKGYDCGTPDGIIGNGSAAAIEKYQSDNDLEVTGTITEELIKSLGL